MGTTYYHALTFRDDICIGCSHCMMVCPTEAIRVKDGKAQMMDDHCIDCGACYKVCPVGAIVVEQDDFSCIEKFEHKVALVPALFTGQFPNNITRDEILQSIYDIGFDDVYEIEYSVDFLSEQYLEYFKDEDHEKPFISTFCPAVIRLIQVKFPTLIHNLMRIKAPLDFTAMYAKKSLIDKGLDADSIGVFYISPCAAKFVAIKSPIGEEKSVIDGVLNMNFVFNKSFKAIKSGVSKDRDDFHKALSKNAINWSLTGGETNNFPNVRSLAIDGINNVVEFLELLEDDEIEGVEFLEMRACDEGCAGGILCPGNRFLTVEKLKNRADFCQKKIENTGKTPAKKLRSYDDYLIQNAGVGKINARSIVKLADEVAEAMSKMKRMFEINGALPQVDCGICGAPSCQSFAEDIVRNKADIVQCIFVQKILEQNEKIDSKKSVEVMKSIWGDKKLDKNSLREELKDII
ncbi:MAG: [Fe-Fe] hydrogenase large subunit C-terminal domain-containing protein [Bacteroidales bacterium]|nr:4Fe-4S binding protein [Bacteroidales bacterium]